ncbi:MAG: ATP-binding protein [Candidatus Promineifilaceae bacterium]|nr:ATP-binding protein [Candidatus Promineifilaceae bacterium]
MRKSPGKPINWRSLTVQLVTAFVLLVLLTAVAVGLPAIWLIQSQSENQAWAQVQQGSRATHALFSALQKEVNGLALLTAQRPPLITLLEQGNRAAIESFLATLQTGTELDLLLVCDAARQPVGLVGEESLAVLCSRRDTGGYYVAPHGDISRLWLLAAEPLAMQSGELETVIVGFALDDAFAAQMKDETGLEHIFFVGGDVVASSLMPAAKLSVSEVLEQSQEEDSARTIFSLNNRPYYATRLNLAAGQLVDEVALEVTNIALTRQRLIRTLIGSILLVALVGSIVGVFLARSIARPLRQLTEAAANLSAQDLETAVTVDSRVDEVTRVAQALETARVDLRRSLTELRQTTAWNEHLLESISEGIMVLDDQGRVTFFSPGAERISGRSQEEVLGQVAGDVFRLAATDEPLQRLSPQPGQIYKITLVLADEKQVTLAVTGAQLLLPSLGMTGTALVFRDISDSERIHHLLGQFLANITHEFRTPLSALAASTELLMDQAADLSAAELKELLNSLHIGVLGLQTLIDNLLESASLEAGHFRVYPRPVDLKGIIMEAMNTMKPLLEKHNQQLDLDLPPELPYVQADPRRIAQVMINLLSNAIKYSPDGSRIQVRAVEEETAIRVAVADQGAGVPPGYRPNLFRRLVHPGEESSKAQYGVGLGLSVVYAIIQAHGGRVGVQDRPQGGALFWFTVPKGSPE